MSAFRGKAEVTRTSPSRRFGPRLCENAHQPRMRRIVFSISFFRQALPVQLVFTSPKSRRKFYTQVERQSFHTASTRTGRMTPDSESEGQEFRISSGAFPQRTRYARLFLVSSLRLSHDVNHLNEGPLPRRSSA